MRSQSFSTLDERHSYAHENDPGVVRIVIDRQAHIKRPKNTDSDSVPRLEIPIPHYRLGHPYFSQRGTPILRSSAYTRESGTDDVRSSYLSKLEYDKLFPHPITVPRHSILTRRHSEAFRQPNRILRGDATMNCLPVATNSNHGEARSASSTPAVHNSSIGFASMPIAPEIFDIIAANPNDSTVVRYSSTGEMAAATPSRLIDHITSPSFLDYELLSDFFLTCRSFLKTGDLISYLIARLRWAVSRDNDYGRIVRVRTFVALRHWILNYFVDDFISDFALRFQFCKAVNELSTEVQSKSDGATGDLKIIGELKKCWRRTCMLYWKNPALLFSESIEDDIHPGDPVNVVPNAKTSTIPILKGKATRSKSKVSGQGEPLRQEQPLQPTHPLSPGASGNVKLLHDPGPSLASSRISAYISEAIPLSPMSEHSVQAASCSIPRFVTPKIGCTGDRPQQIQNDGTSASAVITPKALRMYPSSNATSNGTNFAKKATRHEHKRSGSFSDALRDERAPLSQPMSAFSGGQALISDIPSNVLTGSIVRGAMFPPIMPYVKLMKHGHLASTPQLNCASSRKGATLSDEIGIVGNNGSNDGFAQESEASIAFSTMVSANPGVKKILGSVRRAISGRQPTDKPIADNLKKQTSKAALTSASGTSGAGSSSITTTSSSIDNGGNNIATNWNVANNVKKKRHRNRDKNSAHGQMRVDVLAAKVVSSYNEAVSAKLASDRDDESAAKKSPQMPVSQSNMTTGNAAAEVFGIVNTTTANQDNVANVKSTEKYKDIRLTGDITSGSRSISMANETVPFDKPLLPGFLEGKNSKEVDISFRQQQQQQQQHEPHSDGGSHLSSEFPCSPSSEQDGHYRENMIGNAQSPTAKCPYDPDLSLHPLGELESIQYIHNSSDIGIGANVLSARVSKRLPKKSKSTRSQRSGSASLRQYASYQSGITSQRIKPQYQPIDSVEVITSAGIRSVSAQSSLPPSLSSFPSPSTIPFAHNPNATRPLRRRPGGNLRNFGNVHDLERSRSTGSLSNRTHSITNSMSYKPSDKLYLNGQTSSNGANGLLRENDTVAMVTSGNLARRPYSLVQTHSSQPNLRPSFEAEVVKLAALPDEDDEGAGIEAALLKLEGRFERGYSDALALSPNRLPEMPFAEQKPDIYAHTSTWKSADREEVKRGSLLEDNIQNTRTDALGNSSPVISDDISLPYRSLLLASHDEDVAMPPVQTRKQPLANSDESYSSVPLLQRGPSRKIGSKGRKAGEDFQIGKLRAAAQTRASIEREGNSRSILLSPQLSSPMSTYNTTWDGSGNMSNRRSRSPSADRKLTRSPAARDSFLLDSDESLSDVASDISTGDLIMSTISGSEEDVSFYDDGVGYELFESVLRGGRTRQDIFQDSPGHPPTSVSSDGSVKAAPVAVTSFVEQLLQPQESFQWQQDTFIAPNSNMTIASMPRYIAHPPRPPVSATGIELGQMKLSNQSSLSHPPQSSPSPPPTPLKHIPFILMYSSEILAQQFTIIEKDALDEIDWKELIELRWDQSARGVQTWVEYLLRDSTRASGASCENSGSAAFHDSLMNSRQRRGVDTAIARFNLMVKWAVSECVLTEDIEERARVLVKYIHIATHTRQLRNYATMYQITIALLSSDCSRLTRTWKLVPEAERGMLRALENLVQPLRNFSNLRHEMETAPLEDGCIPFIGK